MWTEGQESAHCLANTQYCASDRTIPLLWCILPPSTPQLLYPAAATRTAAVEIIKQQILVDWEDSHALLLQTFTQPILTNQLFFLWLMSVDHRHEGLGRQRPLEAIEAEQKWGSAIAWAHFANLKELQHSNSRAKLTKAFATQCEDWLLTSMVPLLILNYYRVYKFCLDSTRRPDQRKLDKSILAVEAITRRKTNRHYFWTWSASACFNAAARHNLTPSASPQKKCNRLGLIWRLWLCAVCES